MTSEQLIALARRLDGIHDELYTAAQGIKGPLRTALLNTLGEIAALSDPLETALGRAVLQESQEQHDPDRT